MMKRKRKKKQLESEKIRQWMLKTQRELKRPMRFSARLWLTTLLRGARGKFVEAIMLERKTTK